MDPLKLVCILVGVEGCPFPVDIKRSLMVGDLKKAIKEEKKNKLEAVDADELRLYFATRNNKWFCSSDSDVAALETGGIPDSIAPLLAKKMEEAASIGDLITEFKLSDPSTRQIHVLVVVPKQVVAPTIVSPVIKKRKLLEVRSLITPSSFAKCKGSGSWVKWLKKLDGQIECHRIERSDDQTPIPLVLLSETFARFEHNCKSIEIGKEDFDFVMKLCHGMSVPYENEEALAEKARDLLDDYLVPENSTSRITPATVKGSVSDGSYRLGKVLALNLECKLQKGDGGEDPTMQNVAYYIKNLPDTIDRQIPCFLVDICGPLLSVFGIVNIADEDAICEPLVMSFPLLFFDNEWLMVSLARVCASLKAALGELTNEWHRLTAGGRDDVATDLDRLRFPHKDCAEINGNAVTLRYVEALQRYVFVAKYSGGNEVVVKFTKRYGKEVHEYCANLGFAPALLYYEALPSGWVFVVMEKLPLKHLARAKSSGTMVRDQVLAIKDALEAASFVHGDLRENNVMWDSSKNRVVLIDFDWSGKEGVNTYPPFMNGEIPWPPGAESGKPLQVVHDAHWFDLMLSDLNI